MGLYYLPRPMSENFGSIRYTYIYHFYRLVVEAGFIASNSGWLFHEEWLLVPG